MADYFNWSVRTDRDSKPAGIFTATPFPVIESTTEYTITNDEGAKVYTLGTLYFVDGAKADDTGDGLSLANAKKTIGAAVTAAGAGNKTIVVRGVHDAFDGTYNEAVSFAGSDGTNDTHRLSLIGYGQERPIIDGTGLTGEQGINGVGANYVTLQRLKVQNFEERGVLFATPGSPATANIVGTNLIDVWLYNNQTNNNGDGNMSIYSGSDDYYVDSAWCYHITSNHTTGKGIKINDHTHNCIVEWSVTDECGSWDGLETMPGGGTLHPYGIDFASMTATQHAYGAIWRYNIFGRALLGNEIRYPENISIHHNEFYNSVRKDEWPEHDGTYSQASSLHIRWMLGTGSIYSNIFRDNADTTYPWLMTFVSVAGSTGPYQVYNNLFYNPSGTAKASHTVWAYGYSGLTDQRSIDFFNNSFYANNASGYSLLYIENNIFWQTGVGSCVQASVAQIVPDYNRFYFPSGSRGRDLAAHESDGTPGWSDVPVGVYSAAEAMLTATLSGVDVSGDCAGAAVDANIVTRVAYDVGWLEYAAGGGATYNVYYSANGAPTGNPPSDASAYASGATVTVAANSGSLAKTGSHFAGWNTAADGTGTRYEPGTTFAMPAENEYLYADWVPAYALVR